MRNLKRALSLGLTATMISGLMVMGSSAASYADVTSENHQEAIEVLKSVGIMTGDEKGNFNPEAKVTRNEMAVVMSNLMAYNVKTYANTSPFTDVPEWAEPYVAACYTNGITAGVTATTYGGSESLTTAQAALMVMKALGYFQFQSDFENDWQLATVKQANKIDLFDDVEAGVKEAITRNDLAQLVLNALESGTVEADDDTIKVETGDVSVSAGKVKYNYITSAKDYAEAIDNKTVTNNDGTMSTGCIVELGEKLYSGDLTKKSTTDDFGRPASQWEYQAKEIGTYADTADNVFTAKVTSKKLYDAVGKTAAEDYKWTVSVDGVKADDFSNSTLVKNKANDDADFLKNMWDGMGTGNGVITEVFVDGTDKTVDVAVIHQYAAEVLKVDEAEGTITLSDLSGAKDVADAKDEFETKEFAEDDIVIYTYANGDIQSVYAAEKVEGEVTSVRVKTEQNANGDFVKIDEGDNFVVDGTTYKYNKTMKVGEMLDTDNVNNDVVAYVDANGYVAYVDESAVTYDYAYVLSMGSDNDKWDNDILGTTVYARLVLTDGTVIKVETDEKTTALKNHIVSYSKDKKDVYSLTDRSHTFDLADATNLDVNNDKAGMTLVDNAQEGKTAAVANANTVFIVAESDSESYDDFDFSVYTGVKNVPDIDGDADTKAVVALKDGSNVAKVVYIQDAEVSGATDVIFAYADPTPKYTKDKDGKIFEIDAIKDGEAITLKIKEGSSAAKKLVTFDNLNSNIALSMGDGEYIVALKGLTENADGYVTNVRLYDENALTQPAGKDMDGVITGTGIADKSKDDVVTLTNGGTYTWTEDVVVAQYNDKSDKGEFSKSKMSSIKKDTNDNYLAVLDDGVIIGLLTEYVAGTGDTNNQVTPGVTVTIGASNAITVTTEDKVLTATEALKAIVDYLENMGLTVGTPYLANNIWQIPTYYTVGDLKIPAQTYTWDPTTLNNAQTITIFVNGESKTVQNGTKVSDLDSLNIGKYLDAKGTSVDTKDTVLKSGESITLYGKVTLNGVDQYGKIGDAVELKGNYYNTKANPGAGDADFKAVADSTEKYTVADQVMVDGYIKVQIDAENAQYYNAPHTYNALKTTGTGFIKSEDGGKTWTYVAGASLTTGNKDLMIKKNYVKVEYTASGTQSGYNWSIEAGDGFAEASKTLDVKYTVSNDTMQQGDVITVTFTGATGTDKFNADGTSMTRTAHGLTVGTSDITVSISNVAK